MRKSFMFATMAAAALFAGCSSHDDLSDNNNGKIDGLDGDQVAIEIGVASNASISMRGTGTVGDIADPAETPASDRKNIWHGEQINVLMYEIDADGNPTFDLVKDKDGFALYDGSTTLYTPLANEQTNTGIAKELASGNPMDDYTSAKYKVKYYPQTGRSDFWGYYLGGVGAESALANAATITNSEDKTYQTLGFEIDGTHDLMVAKAPSPGNDEELTTTQTTQINDASGDVDRAKKNAYSATAARQGLQPDLVFKHLLTRLQFKVKAGNKKAADCGVTITGIKVRSKKTGDLIVAYDYTQRDEDAERILWAPVKAEEVFNEGTDDEIKVGDEVSENKYFPALELKQRASVSDRTMTDLDPVELTWKNEGEGEDIISIGEALLVAPQESYYVEVEYTIASGSEADWYKDNASPWEPGEPDGTGATDTPQPVLVSEIVRPRKEAFEEGTSYVVTITLYGPEQIKITATLTGWVQSDDEIEIDPDADDDED